MKPNTSPSSKGSRIKKKQTSYPVWQFALAVPAIAVTLQVMLGSLTPLPQEHNPYLHQYANAYNSYYDEFHHYDNRLYNNYNDHGMPEIEVLPLNLRGDMTGPVLASVLKEYFPQSTPQHADDLRDTLPPGNDPRMIVILPKDNDKPVF